MDLIEKSLTWRANARRLLLGWLRPSLLVLEESRRALNVSLRDHWPNHSIDVFELVHEYWEPPQPDQQGAKPTATSNFIVFIGPQLDVDWISDLSHNKKTEECISFAESIAARRCMHLPHEAILELRRLVGQAIVTAIHGNEQLSNKLAAEAAQFLRDRTIEQSRNWTLRAAHTALLVLSFALAALWYFLQSGNMISPDLYISLWVATQGGVTGAYLSVIQKAGSGEWDAASGRFLHILEVFTKLFAGALLGGVAFAISRSIHCPPSLKATTPDNYSIFLLGLASGCFERLIPKMVSSYAESLQNQEIKTKSRHEKKSSPD